MERLTRKLKKGGYSANRHPAAQIDERLSQLKGVHKQWVGDVSDMITLKLIKIVIQVVQRIYLHLDLWKYLYHQNILMLLIHFQLVQILRQIQYLSGQSKHLYKLDQ